MPEISKEYLDEHGLMDKGRSEDRHIFGYVPKGVKWVFRISCELVEDVWVFVLDKVPKNLPEMPWEYVTTKKTMDEMMRALYDVLIDEALRDGNINGDHLD